jgi:hypothetical protein
MVCYQIAVCEKCYFMRAVTPWYVCDDSLKTYLISLPCLCVHLHTMIQETLKRFALNFILRRLIKHSQHFPVLVKFGQKWKTLTKKTCEYLECKLLQIIRALSVSNKSCREKWNKHVIIAFTLFSVSLTDFGLKKVNRLIRTVIFYVNFLVCFWF